jgi:RHS repeat-associated protein
MPGGEVSGLDYFGARYYNSTMGRFMSPDWADKPEAVPYADLANPQSLNLYQYMRNNPLGGSDPDGHSPDWWQKLVNGLLGYGKVTDAERGCANRRSAAMADRPRRK